jgi:lysozyme family protein
LQKNFNAALAHVLLFEGAYSDHPLDPGGATNLGITQAVLQSYRGQPVSKDDVRALTKKEAAAIYKKNYWEPACCGSLPSGVDFAVFDCAVNQGVGRAARFLQLAANVPADGKTGPATLAAVNQISAEALLGEFMARRMQSYGLLQTLFRTFGLGWSRRLMATHVAAHALLNLAPAKVAQLTAL